MGIILIGKCPEKLRKLAHNPSEDRSSFTYCELKSHWLRRQTTKPKGTVCFHGKVYTGQNTTVQTVYFRDTISNLDSKFSISFSGG